MSARAEGTSEIIIMGRRETEEGIARAVPVLKRGNGRLEWDDVASACLPACQPCLPGSEKRLPCTVNTNINDTRDV